MAKATRCVHAQIIAAGDYPIAWFEGGVGALCNFPYRVYTGGMGIAARDATIAAGGEGIFVVERRITNPDQHVARRKIGDGAMFHLAGEATLGLAND